MGMMNKVCAFTGHRPSKLPWRYNETDSRCVALKTVLTEQITALIEAGVTQFLSGMAEGTDIFCSEIVLALREKNPKIKLHCILPCTAQAEKRSVSSQELYRTILGRADSVVYVSRDYHEKCMLDRNRFFGGTRRHFAGRLQRGAKWWDGSDYTIRSENEPGNHGD